MKRIIPLLFLVCSLQAFGQDNGVPKQWMEILLEGIRNDFARPTVHARNLYHLSTAMYDAWSVYDTLSSEPHLLDNELNGFTCPLDSFLIPTDIEAAREEAISFAAYRLLAHRFNNSPARGLVEFLSNQYMSQQGYSIGDTATNYQSGIPGTMGNYIAQCVINYGLADNANEVNNYINQYYFPVNPTLILEEPQTFTIADYNRWQPLGFDVFIDQSGQPSASTTPPFLSPEWGNVYPFALDSTVRDTFQRNGNNYIVYHDPGPPPMLDTSGADSTMSEYYKWGNELVSKWSSHMDPADTTMWDISPASIGNVQSYPDSLKDYPSFYNQYEGGDPSIGHAVNPKTGLPYDPQLVKRADYARVLAEFWADGPDSETPPGHWFTLLNYIMEHDDFEPRFNGISDSLSHMEYEVKAYLTLGGAMHDAAVSVWGIKGWYDYIRPVSAIRAIALLGQSSDSTLMSYHPGGIRLDSGYIELVQVGDALAGIGNENVGMIKVRAWRGPDYITDPDTDIAGVDWILGRDWWPYQRPTFVTPNFAGYVSGHSTFSRAAADVLTQLTGDNFFPGGMGVFQAAQNNFLVFEEGPSETLELQWATYQDASDQCSLSRIWGGIHPPADDIPGRLIGMQIATDAFNHARELFYNDEDGDGFYNYEDCDDQNPFVHPNATEICDGIDNDCNNLIDEGLTIITYYLDADLDGFGTEDFPLDTCLMTPPMGYAINNLDCNDLDSLINPSMSETCDSIDNDCNNLIDDSLQLNIYYQDLDQDGYGNADSILSICATEIPGGYVLNGLDCNDLDSLINPAASEICDSIDNDCNNIIDDGLPLVTYYKDFDQDGFGNPDSTLSICAVVIPNGYVTDSTDCDDSNNLINPLGIEIANNEIDEDCDGEDLFSSTRNLLDGQVAINPNPFSDFINIEIMQNGIYQMDIYNAQSSLIRSEKIRSSKQLDLSELPTGIYFLRLIGENQLTGTWRLVKW